MPAPGRARRAGSGAWSWLAGTASWKVPELALDNAAAASGVAAVVLLFAGPAFWGPLLGLLAGVATLLATAWLLRRATVRGRSLLGGQAGLRLVLLVAVAGGHLLARPDEPGWIWSATALALLSVLIEGSLAQAADETQQVAVNLPGVPAVPEPPLPFATPAWASLVMAVVGGLLGALAAPGWVYLLAVVLLVLPAAVLAVHVLRARVAATRAATGLQGALEAYRPAFAVYYAAVHGARYQLGMWLPYLDRLEQPYIVITRNPTTLPTITAITDAPVVVPRTKGSVGGLDSIVVDSLKAAFYVQGGPENAYLQRYRQLIHVWLNHGDSDKVSNYAARHATFDKVVVCGQQGVDRYAAHGVTIPASHFAVVGRPQLERIEVHDEPLPRDGYRTVLYAPTWRGGRPATNYSSLRLGPEIVQGLLAHDATVVFRPHPLSYTEEGEAGVIQRIQDLLRADRETTGRVHLCGAAAETERDIPDCINATDALVTDVSSVASDYLASGKPIAMVATKARGQAFRDKFPMARVSYLIEKDLSTLDSALDDLLGNDPLAGKRREYRRYCLGNNLGPEAPEEFLRVAGRFIRGYKT